MRFRVYGVWQGQDVSVGWNAGVLTGHPSVVALLHVHAELRRSGLGPSLVAAGDGRVYDGAGITNPMTFLLLVAQLFDRVDAIGGEDGMPKMELRARSVLRSLRSQRAHHR